MLQLVFGGHAPERNRDESIEDDLPSLALPMPAMLFTVAVTNPAATQEPRVASGAAATTAMTHIAIQEKLDGKTVD